MIIHLTAPVANASLQVGDTAYYSNNGGAPVSLGAITEINASSIRIASNPVIPSGAFLLFAKNVQCNTGSLKGYFSELKMENNSTEYAELYAVSTGATASSK